MRADLWGTRWQFPLHHAVGNLMPCEPVHTPADIGAQVALDGLVLTVLVAGWEVKAAG